MKHPYLNIIWQKTIELDRIFYEAYAYLGRYEYIASNLNLFERKATSLLGYTIEGNLDMIHTVYLLIGKIYQKKKIIYRSKKIFKSMYTNFNSTKKSN
jgi:hypothetical protein